MLSCFQKGGEVESDESAGSPTLMLIKGTCDFCGNEKEVVTFSINERAFKICLDCADTLTNSPCG